MLILLVKLCFIIWKYIFKYKWRTSPYTFDWSNGSTTQDLINEIIGTYSVVVSDSNSCKDTLSNLQILDYSSPINISSITSPETIPMRLTELLM